MKEVFNFASNVTEKASKLILKNLNKVINISYKKSNFNLVTNVDKEVESSIIRDIRAKYPTHTIIAEESGRDLKDPRFKWFIDPIDGTTNFAHGYPCFCTSIAFAINEEIIFGIVKNPLTNETYSAIKNQGARLNNKPISVSKIKTLQRSLLATGFPHGQITRRENNFKNFFKLTSITQGVRRDGAAAMDLCYVACGKLDGFWEIKLSPWDVAAGILLIKEAGGKITSFKGSKFNLYSNEIIASNGLIHKELVKHLR